MSKINIRNLFPSFYDGVSEIDKISSIENGLFEEAYVRYQQVLHNQFINTVDVQGIQQYENMLGIVANSSMESLDLRRIRVINELSATPPYTYQFLCNRLSAISEVFTIESDFDNCQMQITVNLREFGELDELTRFLCSIVPCNIEFTIVNKLINIADLPIFIGGVVSVMHKTNMRCEVGG